MSTSCLEREMITPFKGCLMETMAFMATGRTPARMISSINSCM